MGARQEGRDRRHHDSQIVTERRSGKERRVQCPQCGSPLLSDSRLQDGFRQTTRVCTSSACTFTQISRTVPQGKISLAPAYPLVVERSGRRYMVELPLELCHFAKLEPGGKLLLKVPARDRWILEKD
jgi:hypothetical protein